MHLHSFKSQFDVHCNSKGMITLEIAVGFENVTSFSQTLFITESY